MAEREESRGIGDLLGDLGRQVSTLVRKEIELARVEVTSSLGRMSRGAAMAGAGGALSMPGCWSCLPRPCSASSRPAWTAGWPRSSSARWCWCSAACVTSIGVKQIQSTNMAPTQTAETVRENVEFVKEQMK